MDPISARMVMAAAGAGAAGSGLAVEDVFSTFLYEGNATNRTITNGIDLAGEGGMVWLKNRDKTFEPYIFDTERNINNALITSGSNAEFDSSGVITSWNSDGFGLNNNGVNNGSGDRIASWTFRKAPGFFDIVTYTGDGVFGRTIPHNLGSVPGMIWVKRLNSTRDWTVYHRSLGASDALFLNTTGAAVTWNGYWSATEPTATDFSVGGGSDTNGSGSEYVAYIFAHDDASFGPNGAEDIIKCGSYIGNASTTGPIINLGWEPQWVLIKSNQATTDWYLFDTARGIVFDGNDSQLNPNLTAQEATTITYLDLSPTGFQIKTSSNVLNGNGYEFVYMAIRRSDPAPTAASDFFQITARTGTGTFIDASLNFNPDFMITKLREVFGTPWISNTRGFPDFTYLELDTTKSLTSDTSRVSIRGDIDSTVKYGDDPNVNIGSYNFIDYFWKRARKAFDVVYYSGNGVYDRAIEHGLGAEPQLMWVKRLDNVNNSAIYVKPMGGLFHVLFAAQEARSVGRWTGDPSSTQFFLGSHFSTNAAGGTYVNHLFGNVPGVIDIGGYTGTGSAGLQIDCGFSAGASLVAIKRYDVAGHWYWFDTSRGIVAGSDPALISFDDPEITGTDYIDPYSLGFEIATTDVDLNELGGDYIYMAIA